MRLVRFMPGLILALAACGGTGEDLPARSAGAPLLAVVADPAAPATGELRAGRPAAARAQLERALAEDPDGAGALNDLSVAYAVQERFDAARQLLEEVLARGDARAQLAALVNLGELYGLEGYLGAARSYLEAARAMDPARPEPSYALAALADARGDRAAAQAALRAALDADRSGGARRDLFFVYPEERQHLEALVAEATGDPGAAARWRELARGRFPGLAQAAARHLEEPGNGS